jgi:hypothetical protein
LVYFQWITRRYIPEYTGRSLCRFIRRVRCFSDCLVGTYRKCARQTEDDSFGNDPITESVSVTPPSVAEASLYSGLFCVCMGRVGYNLETDSFHLWLLCENKIHTNHAGENFAVIFPKHVHLEIQFPN